LFADPSYGRAIRDDFRSGLSVLLVWMQEFLRDLLNPAGAAGGPMMATTDQKIIFARILWPARSPICWMGGHRRHASRPVCRYGSSPICFAPLAT